jgi:hypothetical protein
MPAALGPELDRRGHPDRTASSPPPTAAGDLRRFSPWISRRDGELLRWLIFINPQG